MRLRRAPGRPRGRFRSLARGRPGARVFRGRVRSAPLLYRAGAERDLDGADLRRAGHLVPLRLDPRRDRGVPRRRRAAGRALGRDRRGRVWRPFHPARARARGRRRRPPQRGLGARRAARLRRAPAGAGAGPASPAEDLKASLSAHHRVPRIPGERMRVGVPKETAINERRVALVPETVGRLVKSGLEVLVERGAGEGAFCADELYRAAGAGLQAIATARRLGAVVSAFDVRPAVKEQVESLGASFVAPEAVTTAAEAAGGYAAELGEDQQRRELELIHRHIREMDLVITTALIPGRPAPRLITGAMVRDMRSGAVIVDLAAEAGGNCELTRPDETVREGGVTVLGPLNLPATVPLHASQMYSRNLQTLLQRSEERRVGKKCRSRWSPYH